MTVAYELCHKLIDPGLKFPASLCKPPDPLMGAEMDESDSTVEN